MASVRNYLLTILNTLYTPDIKWTIFDFYFLSTVLQGAYLQNWYNLVSNLEYMCTNLQNACKTMKICVWQKSVILDVFFNDCIKSAILKYSFSWGKKCQTNKNSSNIPLNISFRNCSLFKTSKFLYLLETKLCMYIIKFPP